MFGKKKEKGKEQTMTSAEFFAATEESFNKDYGKEKDAKGEKKETAKD